MEKKWNPEKGDSVKSNQASLPNWEGKIVSIIDSRHVSVRWHSGQPETLAAIVTECVGNIEKL